MPNFHAFSFVALKNVLLRAIIVFFLQTGVKDFLVRGFWFRANRPPDQPQWPGKVQRELCMLRVLESKIHLYGLRGV